MTARLAAMRLLPIRSRYSRYDNHPATNAAPSITMTPPQTKASTTVRIENVRSIGRILPSPLEVGRRLRATPRAPHWFAPIRFEGRVGPVRRRERPSFHEPDPTRKAYARRDHPQAAFSWRRNSDSKAAGSTEPTALPSSPIRAVFLDWLPGVSYGGRLTFVIRTALWIRLAR
jgi:hypothetical protein